MDFESLPEDLIRELLLRLDSKTLLSRCHTNRHIAEICGDDNFWMTKLYLDYPQYVGSPYRNSWKSTVIALISPTFAQVLDEPPHTMQKFITPYSPLSWIISFGYYGTADKLKSSTDDLDIDIKEEKGKIILYNTVGWKRVLNPDTPIYSILLPDNNNLFFSLQTNRYIISVNWL